MASQVTLEAKTGPWQKIYWSEGPGLAREYCIRIVQGIWSKAEIVRSLLSRNNFKDLKVSHALLLLKGYFADKQNHYVPDGRGGPCCDQRISIGRGEPGRSPFSFPDFRHRFMDDKSLLSFLNRKIEMHLVNLDAINTLLSAFPDQNDTLLQWQKTHLTALEKWTERKESAERDPGAFLIPPPVDPFEHMGIRWAHDHGYDGRGAKAIVIEEGGIDHEHPALQEALLEPIPVSRFDRQIQIHGTHVCGMIAARKMGGKGCVGAAPQAQLQIITSCLSSEIIQSPIDIVNVSCCKVHPLARIMSATLFPADRLRRHIESVKKTDPGYASVVESFFQLEDPARQKDLLTKLGFVCQSKLNKSVKMNLHRKLEVKSNGNGGVNLSESHFHRSRELHSLNDLSFCIRVVNLLPNGLYPHPNSNLPGEEFAAATICAIGTNVESTFPGGEYGKESGTSMAATLVSSCALLIKGACPYFGPKEIRACILDSALPIVLDETYCPKLIKDPQEMKTYSEEQICLSRSFFGVGLLNVKGAIKLAVRRMGSSPMYTPRESFLG